MPAVLHAFLMNASVLYVEVESPATNHLASKQNDWQPANLHCNFSVEGTVMVCTLEPVPEGIAILALKQGKRG